MIKEKLQEAIDLLNQYHYKDGYFFDKENNKIDIIRKEDNLFLIRFIKSIKNIIIEIKVCGDIKIYVDRYYETKKEEYYCFSENVEIKFDKNGNIDDSIDCSIKNLPKNIFDWTEEDFFYMRLKNG